MTRRLRTTESTFKAIRDTGPSLARVEARNIETSLGAETSAATLERALAPITLFALRDELARRLQSSGGRPALSGSTRRAKIPLSDAEWLELEELAAAISGPGFAPTAGQVASVLLRLSAHSVASQVSKHAGAAESPIVEQLAARTAAARARDAG